MYSSLNLMTKTNSPCCGANKGSRPPGNFLTTPWGSPTPVKYHYTNESISTSHGTYNCLYLFMRKLAFGNFFLFKCHEVDPLMLVRKIKSQFSQLSFLWKNLHENPHITKHLINSPKRSLG